jgi:hypothetical protein
VISRGVVFVLDIFVGLVVGKETQRLVRLDRPADLFVDIRLDELGTPISVVALELPLVNVNISGS